MLINLADILKQSTASNGRMAIGSFSIINVETIFGTIKAAEALNTPIIMQIAEPRLKYMPLDLIAPAMVSAAKASSVPVCVHFDHGQTEQMIIKAIEYGFTSVMIDASHNPYDKNVEITRRICQIAHSRGVSCEGEIGKLGFDEEGTALDGAALTGVNEAAAFAHDTGVDALAIAIGNQHGIHTAPPKLDFLRLTDIRAAVVTPLVLHGGSGTTPQEFRQCIAGGITKINVATATLNRIMHNAREFFQSGEQDYFKFHELVVKSTFDNVCEHIKIFNGVHDECRVQSS